MAIAKMKKVMLVAPNQLKDELLNAIQELQNLEFIESPIEEDMDETIFLSSSDERQDLIKEKEDFHTLLEDSLSFLKRNQPQVSFIQKYKNPREEYRLDELSSKVADFTIDEKLQLVKDYQKRTTDLENERKDLLDKEELLRKWEGLYFHPNELAHQQYTKTILGTIPQTVDNQYRKVLDNSELIFVNEIFHTRDEVGVLLTYSRKDRELIKEDLIQAHFTRFRYPFKQSPKVELRSVLDRQKSLALELSDVKKEIAKDQDTAYQLQLASEVAYNELEKERSKELFLTTNHLFIMEGWLKEKDVEQVRNQLSNRIPSAEYAFFEQEIDQEEFDKVPISLENHKFVAPFESLVGMYGLPKYGELDPTPFMMPFYMTFFGLMAADVGYGILLWLGTYAMLRFLHLDKGFKKNIQFFHALSYPTIIWGLVFGSFLGFDLPFRILSLSTDMTTLMLMSIIFGVIQIMLSLALGAYTNVKKKDYVNAYLNHIGWLLIFIGGISYVLGSMVIHQPLLAQVGMWLAIVAAVVIVLVSVFASKNKAAGLASGLYNLYGVSGYVGDMVSYTRLMALAVSGGSIASAFNLLVGFLPPIARFTVGLLLFIALHALNIFLSFLGAYVHGMRLQFVEFFGKFYEGGGRAFNPFKTYEKYIYINANKTEKMEEK
ncbi:V-type ATP synthase subunit I [Granulicatella seriolae]|uniref:V-type ATP synthase subunit I n=1 Tax=Granulicatella seriolae TaxID=2967226 RepID=A0ABT1WMF6_9LACT|nr:V-type ATP synthase subunit I [Granulicatella seriolae]